MKSPLRALLSVTLGVALAASLGACAQTDGKEPEEKPSAATGSTQGWPREVTVGSQTVSLAAKPRAIVALTTETSDVSLQLAGSSRLVAISKSSVTPGLGNEIELARAVPNTFRENTPPDPEQILALNPDLVITTGRHGNDQKLAAALAQSGVPTATFETSDFATPQAVSTTLLTMGKLLGEEDKATKLAKSLDAKVESVLAKLPQDEQQSRPGVICLFKRGNTTMIMGSDLTLPLLVEQAGGNNIAKERGWRQGIPAEIETIIAAKPQVILVQDFMGQGLDPFQELLANPALSEVEAIREHRVHLVAGNIASATAATRLGEGLEEVANMLHSDR